MPKNGYKSSTELASDSDNTDVLTWAMSRRPRQADDSSLHLPGRIFSSKIFIVDLENRPSKEHHASPIA